MAAIISMAVAAVGTFVGTAIGAAIGGTILGVSAATIGGIIGAGIAGGILSYAKGGSFGQGFLMGAAGGAIGSYFKGAFGAAGEGLDAASGAAVDASGAAIEAAPSVLEAGGSAASMGTESASAMGDMATGASTGAETFGLDAAMSTPEGVALDATTGMAAAPEAASSLGTMFDGASLNAASTSPTLATSAGFSTPAPAVNADPFALTPGAEPGAPLLSSDYSSAAPSNAPSTLEGMGAAPQQGSYNMSNIGEAPQVPTNGGGMLQQADGWLKDKLGMPQGSTGKLMMGGMDAYMKNREASKLNQMVNQNAPMSYQQFEQQYSDPNAYKLAANQMARSGRTGTLPVLLARMRNATRAKYAGYLPGAQQQHLSNKAAVGNARMEAANSIPRSLYSLDWGKA